MVWLSRTARVFLTRHRTGPVAMRRVWVSSQSSSLLSSRRPKTECSISKWWVKIHLQVAEWMNEENEWNSAGCWVRTSVKSYTKKPECFYLSGLWLSCEALTVRDIQKYPMYGSKLIKSIKERIKTACFCEHKPVGFSHGRCLLPDAWGSRDALCEFSRHYSV